jgi:hypothetical protein
MGVAVFVTAQAMWWYTSTIRNRLVLGTKEGMGMMARVYRL